MSGRNYKTIGDTNFNTVSNAVNTVYYDTVKDLLTKKNMKTKKTRLGGGGSPELRDYPPFE